MVDPEAMEDYRNARVQYAQAKELLQLARCHRSRALSALIESDCTLTGVVKLALRDDEFYERLKALLHEYPEGTPDYQ